MLTTGQRIKQLRKSRKLSQERLADILGVSLRAVSEWERDSHLPSIDNILLLSEFFGVSVKTIVKGGKNT